MGGAEWEGQSGTGRMGQEKWERQHGKYGEEGIEEEGQMGMRQNGMGQRGRAKGGEAEWERQIVRGGEAKGEKRG